MTELAVGKTNRNLKAANAVSIALPPILLIAALIAAWQIICVTQGIPKWMVAKPSDIAVVIGPSFINMLPHIFTTYTNILIGFVSAVAIGLGLAVLIASFKMVGSALTPLIVAMCCIPMITLVPMLMLTMGLGREVKIVAIIIQAFPLVNMNAVVAFLNVDPARMELMQSLKANKLQQFKYCIFPDAAHGIFTGVKLASIMSMIVGVSAEMVGGNTGLGNRISYLIQFSKTADAMACIIFIAVFGILLYGLISLLEKKIRW